MTRLPRKKEWKVQREQRIEPASRDRQADTLSTLPRRTNPNNKKRTWDLSRGVTSLLTACLLRLWNKSPRSAPELHRGVFRVLSVHSIRNLNNTPPFSYNLSSDFSVPTTWLPWLIRAFKGPRRWRYRIKISRETFFPLVKNADFCEGGARASLRLVRFVTAETCEEPVSPIAPHRTKTANRNNSQGFLLIRRFSVIRANKRHFTRREAANAKKSDPEDRRKGRPLIMSGTRV